MRRGRLAKSSRTCSACASITDCLILSSRSRARSFHRTIEQAVARRDVLVQAMKSLMKEGVDYGTIPGSTKPALLQPGADKLGNLFGLTLQYEFLEKEEDWKGERYGEPFFYYQVRARVYRGDFLLGEGVGSCSSWESKYRRRKAERTCPNCGK